MHRNYPSFYSRGFTLIELLVVIFIISLVVAAASFTLGDNQADRMKQKSQQLAALIDLAKEQAIFNSQELGLLFTENSYAFYRLNTALDKEKKEVTVWQPIDDDRILIKRTLPDGLEYELFLEGTKVTFAASKLKEITPHVFILSDGSVSPFEINITDKIDHKLGMKFAENGEYEFAAVN